ncbi:protein mono-ADP-ribosyltransferase TIPARP isoform X2 [Xenopus laevis]|nr:protein mono-ADP-ribosyltransferase TIPARP isoform X2 [Xenopus laevis]
MDIYNSPEIDRVRRLSTSTDPSVHFHTSYKYFYEESDDKWIEYDKDFMSAIAEGLRNKQDTVTYSNPLFKYDLHLTRMYQLNLQTGTMRRMARRPIFRSTVTMQAELQTFSGHEPTSHSTHSNPHPDVAAQFPGSWIITNPKVTHESILLTYGDREFAHVYTYFHSTMSESQYIILEMTRIQNYFQWDKYKRKRDHMIQQLNEGEQKQLERHLFHGTEHILVEAICRHNFDPRVSGKNGTIYGQGCYFAKDASYSHRYAKPTSEGSEGYHYMFLAKVLVGRPARGTQALRRPPPIYPNDPSSPLYDSCVSQLNNPDVFVIFDSDQFYPYFLIKYQKTQNMVILA